MCIRDRNEVRRVVRCVGEETQRERRAIRSGRPKDRMRRKDLADHTRRRCHTCLLAGHLVQRTKTIAQRIEPTCGHAGTRASLRSKAIGFVELARAAGGRPCSASPQCIPGGETFNLTKVIQFEGRERASQGRSAGTSHVECAVLGPNQTATAGRTRWHDACTFAAHGSALREDVGRLARGSRDRPPNERDSCAPWNCCSPPRSLSPPARRAEAEPRRPYLSLIHI